MAESLRDAIHGIICEAMVDGSNTNSRDPMYAGPYADQIMAELLARTEDEICWCAFDGIRRYSKIQCFTQKGKKRAKHDRCGIYSLVKLV